MTNLPRGSSVWCSRLDRSKTQKYVIQSYWSTNRGFHSHGDPKNRCLVYRKQKPSGNGWWLGVPPVQYWVTWPNDHGSTWGSMNYSTQLGFHKVFQEVQLGVLHPTFLVHDPVGQRWFQRNDHLDTTECQKKDQLWFKSTQICLTITWKTYFKLSLTISEKLMLQPEFPGECGDGFSEMVTYES